MKSETVISETPARTRWMIVDDNAHILDVVATLIAAVCDAEICRFQSGAEALRAFAAAPESFRFVITDLDMPGMSGIELCHRLRAQAPGLKILLSTGSGIVTREEAHRLGFCGLLNKPFPLAALRYALEAAGVLGAKEKSFSSPPALCAAA